MTFKGHRNCWPNLFGQDNKILALLHFVCVFMDGVKVKVDKTQNRNKANTI